MSASGSIRVMIVDDHPVVREGLTAILSRPSDMQVVAEAANGREAVAQFRAHRPDVTLMDLRMPELSGVDAMIQIRRFDPAARVVMLTIYDGEEEVYRSLSAGARSFLLKDTPRDQLIEVVRAVHRGQIHVPPDMAAKLAARTSGQQLTPRELEVLCEMVQGRGNLEIARNLYIAEGTVKAHINSILAKLRATDRTQAVTTAMRRGLVYLE